MLRLMLLASLTGFLGPASTAAKTIDATITGSWYNPAQDGHGLSVEYLNESTTVIYWYVYTPDGEPTFLTVAASNAGDEASGAAFMQEGMRFGSFDPAQVQRSQWGTVNIRFNSCDSLTLNYSSSLPDYGSGAIEMQKLVSVPGVFCRDQPVQGNYRMVYFDDAGSETRILEGLALFTADGFASWGGPAADGSGAVGIGSWQETADGLTLSGQNFALGGGISAFEASIELAPDGIFVQSAQEDFDGTPLPSFQRPLAAVELAGDYEILAFNSAQLGNEPIGSLSVQADGTISGSFGICDLSGTLSVPDPQFNQVLAEWITSGCAKAGALLGAAFVADTGELPMTLAGNGAGFLLTLVPVQQRPVKSPW